MKFTATLLITTQITQQIEVEIPDQYDFNPVQWDEWENVLDEVGIRPTVLNTDVVSATTKIIQFTMSERSTA